MAPFYRDARFCVDTQYVVEAHCVDGNAEMDGIYAIVCTLKIYESIKEVTALYMAATTRDAAFEALGKLVTS